MKKYIGILVLIQCASTLQTLFQKNDLLTDRFGRQNFMTVSGPFDIRSERITNGGGTINSAVLEQGWLRVQASTLIGRPKVPVKKGLLDAIPGMGGDEKPTPDQKKKDFFNQGPRLNAGGVPLTAPPLDTQSEGFKMLMNEENGMLVNPSQKEGTMTPVPCKSCFQFRLSGLNLQFTQVREDMTVVGAVSIKNIADVQSATNPGDCFRIMDKESDNWVLCTGGAQEKHEWTCAIKQALGKPCKPDEAPKTLVEKQKVFKPLWIIPLPSPICNEKWNYDQVGHDWNCKCFEGQSQSPIDLPGQSQCKEEKEPIVMDYAEANTFNGAGLKMINDENMLRIRADDFGSILTPEGVSQQAVELVFHTPSDHVVMGKRYPMEIQILHKATSEGDIGKKAIVSVLVDTVPGVKNEFFENLDYMNLPTPNDPERPLQGGIDLNKLFQDNSEKAGTGVSFSQWRQNGSVPMPPCDERTDHFIKATPIHLGMSVSSLFKEALVALDPETNAPGPESHNHNGNSRALQPLNGRTVKFFNDNVKCAEERLQNIASELAAGGITGDSGVKGHWEKVEKKYSKYFFVDKGIASGVPGAFVVPENQALNLKHDE